MLQSLQLLVPLELLLPVQMLLQKRRLLLDGLHHFRVPMPQRARPPARYNVDVRVVLIIEKMDALAANDVREALFPLLQSRGFKNIKWAIPHKI